MNQFDEWASDYKNLPISEKKLWEKDQYIMMRQTVAKYFTEHNATTLMYISLFEHGKAFKPELQTVIDAIDSGKFEYTQEGNYLESLTHDVWIALMPYWWIRVAIKIKSFFGRAFDFNE